MSLELLRSLRDTYALDLKIELLYFHSEWLAIQDLQLLLETPIEISLCSNPIKSGLVLLKSLKLLSKRFPKYS